MAVRAGSIKTKPIRIIAVKSIKIPPVSFGPEICDISRFYYWGVKLFGACPKT
jgi:hypothetical protein